MTSPSISLRQRRILEFICDHVAEWGYPPSVREIAKQCELSSTSAVHHQLVELELKGYLRRQPGRSRAIQVTWSHGEAA